MTDFCILIIKGSNSDLSKLEFPDFEILNIDSKEFNLFLDETFTKKEDFLDKIIEDNFFYKRERYAIIHKDKTQKFSNSKIYKVYNFIKILFPSSLVVEYILDYSFNLDLKYLDSLQLPEDAGRAEFYLEFDENYIVEINNFIRNHFKYTQEIKYLNSAMINYMNAYEASHFHFSFIAFCICLESVITDNNELLYRISRAVTILCSENKDQGNIIFKNLKKIYSLRSKIVHGSDFSDDLVDEYLYYLECICSKVIIELTIHKIEKNEDLNNRFTELGFGDRSKISSNWFNFKYNNRIQEIIYKLL